MKKSVLVLFLILVCVVSQMQALEISGSITDCHDPSTIIYADGKYWCFSTDNNLLCRTSTNLRSWSWATDPFNYADGVPSYMADYLTTCEGNGPWNLWAPDIIKVGSLYYLYYSRNMCGNPVSTERSVCGLAMGSSLTSRDWIDQGSVLWTAFSQTYRRNIDPTLLFDTSGNLWMAVGSFGYPDGNGWTYGGIWLYQMDTATGLIKSGTTPTQLARAWIEAPCLYYKNGYYYLFFNQQSCCVGTNSKYYIRYGRATNITGPYYDKEGVNLLTQNTGGSLFLGRDYFTNYDDANDGTAQPYLGSVGPEIGPGHFGYFTGQDGLERFSFHFYDANNNGNPTLAIRTLIWGDDGWPRAGWNLADGNYAITCGMNRDAGAPAGGLFMEIPNGYSDVAQLWNWNGGLNQIWNFSRVAANQYKITCQVTGKSLAIVSGAVKLVTYTGSSSQKWYVEQINNRAFKILNVSTGQALQVTNSTNTAGAAMSAGVWNTAQVSNQCFWLTPVGIYNMQNKYGNRVAGVANSSLSTRLDIWDWFAGNYQKWRFVPTYDGYTKIINVGSGLVADLKNGSADDGTNIEQYSDLNNDPQKWAIERLSDDSFRILNKADGKAWRAGGSANGAFINQIRWYHTLDQQWTFQLQSASPYARTWTGAGALGNWSDTNNWDIPSYQPDALQFGPTTGLTSTNNFTAGYQVSSIKFISGAGAFTLNGNLIGLLGDIVNQSINLATINFPLQFLQTKSYYFAAESGNIAVTGAISGAGSLVKNGAYALTLSGGNSYSGSTQILAGSLKMGADNVLPPTTVLSISAGAALDLNGTDQVVNTLSNLGSIINTNCMRAVLTVISPSQRIILPGNGMEDLDAMAGQWLESSCTSPDWCNGADRNHSGLVDLGDFEHLASFWLECN